MDVASVTHDLLKSTVPAKRTPQEIAVRLNRVKKSLSVVIGRFRSILFVSVFFFQGSLAVVIIMIDGREKRTSLVTADLSRVRVSPTEKRNNIAMLLQ